MTFQNAWARSVASTFSKPCFGTQMKGSGRRPPIVEEAQLEAGRHHADDRIGIAGIETHGAADDRRVAAEVHRPERMTEDRDAGSAALVLLRQKRPAVQHRRAQHREELLANTRRGQIAGLAAGGVEVECKRLDHRRRLERAGALEPIDGVGRRHVQAAFARLAVVLPERHHSLRLRND